MFDFNFFDKIMEHPKLDTITVILLLDTLSNVYLNDPVFSSAAAWVIIKIFNWFKTTTQVWEFIEKFIQLGIGMIPELDFDF